MAVFGILSRRVCGFAALVAVSSAVFLAVLIAVFVALIHLIHLILIL
mgnify:CR=1 FL=1